MPPSISFGRLASTMQQLQVQAQQQLQQLQQLHRQQAARQQQWGGAPQPPHWHGGHGWGFW